MSIFSRSIRYSIQATLVLAFAGSACVPVPDSNMLLTSSQKQADMYWLYSQFESNYAPLEYKQQLYGFEFEKLKEEYLAKALATKTNEEFYLVMKSFVARFKDAHTTTSFTVGGLKNRAKIAYIGISGKRKGNAFVVTELLPTYNQEGSHFPIQVGDEITHMDGKPLADLIREQILETDDVGQDETNLTINMNRLFSRISTSNSFPTQPDAVITISNRKGPVSDFEEDSDESDGSDEESDSSDFSDTQSSRSTKKKSGALEVTVPWNIKDVYEFKKDQAAAPSAAGKLNASLGYSPMDIFQVHTSTGAFGGFIGLRGFDNELIRPSALLAKSIEDSLSRNFLETFYFPNPVESWTAQISLDQDGNPVWAEKSPLAKLKAARSVPKSARFVTAPDATFPTYITEETAYDSHGKKKPKPSLVATMYLNTFSPTAPAESVLAEFKQTLETLQLYRVRYLIIDLLNNGGGSLSLGMHLAQALSPKQIKMPKIQFRLSDSWLSAFQKISLNGPSDSERTLAQRVVNQFEAELAQHQRMSSSMPLETLIPYELKPNQDLRRGFKTILMVNEMCASMCDIFSAILQDNRLATVLGSKTMGAGGNVVTYYHAPNSHMAVRQTESLIVRTGRTPEEAGYLENRGVEPDFPVSVNKYSDTKYQQVRAEAVKKLLRPSTAASETTSSTGGKDQDRDSDKNMDQDSGSDHGSDQTSDQSSDPGSDQSSDPGSDAGDEGRPAKRRRQGG